jgi:HEAT repeats
MSNDKKNVSAADLMARLERDPQYQGRQRAEEQARQARIAINSAAAAPVVQELVTAGFSITTIADLHNKRLDYEAAVPILLAWLPKVQNVDVKQDIVRCLSTPHAKPMAARLLINEFRLSKDERPTGLRWTIGNALEVVADDTVVDDMIELATDRQYGKAREMLVMGLGNMSEQLVVPVLLALLNDDDVSGHAIKALGRLSPPSARASVEPFLKHPKEWVRQGAAKTLEKIDEASVGSRRRDRPTRDRPPSAR